MLAAIRANDIHRWHARFIAGLTRTRLQPVQRVAIQ
jgi:hypothetical protein